MYRQQFPDHPGMHNTPPGASYTRVRYEPNPTFCDQVKRSLLGVIVGIVLLIVACCLLFWNEGRAVQTARMLDEGLSIVQPLQSPEVVSAQHDGKLVHVTGQLRTGQLLYDAEYEVAIPCVKMRRIVELLQWVEHRSEREIWEGDHKRIETTYSYTTEWRSDIVNSNQFDDQFNHRNPTEMPVKRMEYTAHDAKLGSFSLSQGLLDKVNNYKTYTIATEVPVKLQPYVKLKDNAFYHGRDPNYPVVGDLRVKFEYAGYTGDNLGNPDSVSVIARQTRERLTGYTASEGGTIELLYMGLYSPQKMFGAEQANNTFLTWCLRGLGWFLLFIAFNMVTQIIVTLVDWIPIVCELVMLGALSMNACLSVSVSLTVIALGWIRYRPLLGWTILLCSLAPFAFSKYKANARRRSSND